MNRARFFLATSALAVAATAQASEATFYTCDPLGGRLTVLATSGVDR